MPRFLIISAALVSAISLLYMAFSLSGGSPASQTQIVMLGTGTPSANPERSGPSVAIVVNGIPYIVDFGPGVVRRAAYAAHNGISGLGVSNLSTAFLTHLHSDHTLGYADLIITPWVLGRTEPLEVYGPVGLKKMTTLILAAYREDIDIRTKGLERGNLTGHKVNAYEVKPGIIYSDANVIVTAFLVNHGSWPEALGYRFETPDKIIVISGDTAPSRAVIDNCNGCDVLIHEVYSQARFNDSSTNWQNYMTNFHTSSRELAEIATRAKPDLLVLYHQIFNGTAEAEKELLDEIRRLYKGKVVSAHDLEVY